MKKFILFILASTILSAGDLILGFGYGSISAKSTHNSTDYGSNDMKDINYKLGWEFTNHSRILIQQNNPSMKEGEELTFSSFSWQAIDQTNPYIKGFFGLSVGQFTYKNQALGVEEYKATPYGVELGIMLLEDGDWLKHMEMEFGYRYYTGMSEDKNFKVKEFTNTYVGFNFLF